MNQLIQNYVTRAANERPEAVAVSWKGTQLTYGELEARTNQLARLLKSNGCQPGDRICFCIPKSPEAIISMIGTLKADCVYVPVDSDSPAARVAKVLQSCRPRGILTTPKSTKLFDEVLAEIPSEQWPFFGSMHDDAIHSENVISKFSLGDLSSQSDEPLEYQNKTTDAAHILFTSGSTGVPKGVVITHQNDCSFVEWGVKYFGVNATDRVSGHAPLHFDLSTYDIYGAFAAGATLFPVPPELNLLPHKMADFIRTNELTQWFSVPSILNYMAKFDVVAENDFPTLKRLMWCGEVLPTPTLIHWMERLPHVQFTNLYGPTEATIASSYYTVPVCPADPTETVPIGEACEGEELLVLDSDLRPLPPGEIGDLYIRGIGLSPGYWEDQEKTAGVFINNPNALDGNDRIYKTGDLAKLREDGLVDFLGRADTQIKSRGYRIELGEIETALAAFGFLKESAIVAIDTEGFENKAICCAYVPADGEDVPVSRLRAELGKAVPRYMMPSEWLSFEQLPKNANGKIDRPRLRELFTEATQAAETAKA